MQFAHEEIPEFQVSPYRWLILFAFFNLLVSISSVQTSLTPVCQPLAVAFKVKTIVVTMSSIVFSITYIPMTFIAIKMFKEMSLSKVFRIACVIAIFGAWIRVLAEESKSFTWILIGYTVISLAYPILLSAITLICNKWLGDSERTVITQLCGLAIPIGTIVSFVLSGIIFSDPDTLIAETKTLVLVQNIWITSFASLLFIVIRDKPESPPSAVATQDQPRRNLALIFKEVFKLRSYVLLLVVFGLIDGSFISFSSIMSVLFAHYNLPGQPIVYSTGWISMYGGVTAVFGVMSSMICGCFLQRTHKYLLTIRIVCLLTTVMISVGLYTIPSEQNYFVLGNFVLLGIVMVPIIPVSMNFGSELTFPIAPIMTNGILLMVGQGMGAVLGIVETILADYSVRVTLSSYGVICGIAFFCSIFIKEDLKKTKFAKKARLDSIRISRMKSIEIKKLLAE